jgi:Family of unknown function (DUF6152)
MAAHATRSMGHQVRFLAPAYVVVITLFSAGSVVAHHGSAAYDAGKKIVLKGSVTEWVWANPHCFLKFDVQDTDGTIRKWIVETSNPPDMINRGWTRASFKVGDAVTATVEPVKSGNPVGRVLEVTLADGRVLSTAGPPASAIGQ